LPRPKAKNESGLPSLSKLFGNILANFISLLHHNFDYHNETMAASLTRVLSAVAASLAVGFFFEITATVKKKLQSAIVGACCYVEKRPQVGSLGVRPADT
jgi:hypothetical protein